MLNHRPHRLQAFTLIELLAVVAVILLLLSFLMPALNAGRQRAEFIKCVSNLRQLGSAALLYASDEKTGDWPGCWDWIDSEGGGYTVGGYWIEWGRPDAVDRGTMIHYVGDSRTSVFLCPTFAKVCLNNPGLPTLVPYASYDECEYIRGTNGGTWETSFLDKTKGYSIHRNMLVKPSKEGIFCEEDPWKNDPYAGLTSWMNNFCFGAATFDNLPQGPGGSTRDALGSFHLPPNGDLTEGYGNVWCADGHVQKAHPRESKDWMTPYFVKREWSVAKANTLYP